MQQSSSYLSRYDDFATPEDKMATRIQNTYRSHSSVRIYRFMRSLVDFRSAGDPKQLLKTINPAEASLFDASTKISLRFRLGGSSFPPTLYYKIFTAAPVADINSFAPRDYTRDVVDPDQVHRTGGSEFARTVR